MATPYGDSVLCRMCPSQWKKWVVPTFFVSQEPRKGCFSSLRDAVRHAAPNSRIELYAGVYSEKVVVDKPLEIVAVARSVDGGGGGSSSSSVDGSESAVVLIHARAPLALAAPEAFIEGLTLRATEATAALRVESGSPMVRQCHVQALHVTGSATPSVENCTIEGSSVHGLHLDDSASGTFSKNTIKKHAGYCVYIESRGAPLLTYNIISEGSRGLVLVGGSPGSCGVGGTCAPQFQFNRISDAVVAAASSSVGISPSKLLTLPVRRVGERVILMPLDRGRMRHCGPVDPLAPEEEPAMSSTSTRAAVDVVGCTAQPQFMRNTVVACQQNGFYIHDGGGGVYERNYVATNVVWGFLIAGATTAVELRGNHIRSNGGGVRIIAAPVRLTQGNQLVDNHGPQIVLVDTHANCVVEQSDICSGSRTGVWCMGAGTGQIIRNVFSECATALLIEKQANPLVNENFFDACGTGVLACNSGAGRFAHNDFSDHSAACVTVVTGATPRFTNCRMTTSAAGAHCASGGLGHFERCHLFENHGVQVDVAAYANPVFVNCLIACGRREGVLIGSNGRGHFRHNVITHNGGAQIRVTTSGDPIFEENVIKQAAADGVVIEEGGGGTLLRNVVTACGRNGITVEGIQSYPTLRANHISGCKLAGLALLGGALGTYEKNKFTANANAHVSVVCVVAQQPSSCADSRLAPQKHADAKGSVSTGRGLAALRESAVSRLLPIGTDDAVPPPLTADAPSGRGQYPLLRNNHLHITEGVGILLEWAAGVVAQENTFTGCNVAVQARARSHVIAIRNQFSAVCNGVAVMDHSSASLACNVFSDVVQAGVVATSCRRLVAAWNVMWGCGTGLTLERTAQALCFQNVIRSPAEAGIVVGRDAVVDVLQNLVQGRCAHAEEATATLPRGKPESACITLSNAVGAVARVHGNVCLGGGTAHGVVARVCGRSCTVSLHGNVVLDAVDGLLIERGGGIRARGNLLLNCDCGVRCALQTHGDGDGDDGNPAGEGPHRAAGRPRHANPGPQSPTRVATHALPALTGKRTGKRCPAPSTVDLCTAADLQLEHCFVSCCRVGGISEGATARSELRQCIWTQNDVGFVFVTSGGRAAVGTSDTAEASHLTHKSGAAATTTTALEDSIITNSAVCGVLSTASSSWRRHRHHSGKAGSETCGGALVRVSMYKNCFNVVALDRGVSIELTNCVLEAPVVFGCFCATGATPRLSHCVIAATAPQLVRGTTTLTPVEPPRTTATPAAALRPFSKAPMGTDTTPCVLPSVALDVAALMGSGRRRHDEVTLGADPAVEAPSTRRTTLSIACFVDSHAAELASRRQPWYPGGGDDGPRENVQEVAFALLRGEFAAVPSMWSDLYDAAPPPASGATASPFRPRQSAVLHSRAASVASSWEAAVTAATPTSGTDEPSAWDVTSHCEPSVSRGAGDGSSVGGSGGGGWPVGACGGPFTSHRVPMYRGARQAHMCPRDRYSYTCSGVWIEGGAHPTLTHCCLIGHSAGLSVSPDVDLFRGLRQYHSGEHTERLTALAFHTRAAFRESLASGTAAASTPAALLMADYVKEEQATLPCSPLFGALLLIGSPAFHQHLPEPPSGGTPHEPTQGRSHFDTVVRQLISTLVVNEVRDDDGSEEDGSIGCGDSANGASQAMLSGAAVHAEGRSGNRSMPQQRLRELTDIQLNDAFSGFLTNCGVVATSGGGGTLRSCVFTRNASAARIEAGAAVTLVGCIIREQTGTALQVDAGGGGVIRGCQLVGNKSAHLALSGKHVKTLVHDNDFCKSLYPAIVCSHHAEPVIMENRMGSIENSAVLVQHGARPTISGNTIAGCRVGLEFSAGGHGTAEGNLLQGNTESGIRVNGGSASAAAAPRLVRNRVWDNKAVGVAVVGAGAAPLVWGNNIARNASGGVSLARGAKGTIGGNRMVANATYGIRADESGGHFERNLIADTVGVGVVIVKCGDGNLVMAHNVISGSTSHGISVSSSAGTLQHNHVYLNARDGIVLEGGGAQVSLVANELTANDGSGLSFTNGCVATATYNVCSGNQSCGIRMTGSGTAPIVAFSTIKANRGAGMVADNLAAGMLHGSAITHTVDGPAVRVESDATPELSSCVLARNPACGVVLSTGTRVALVGCVFFTNGGAGVVVEEPGCAVHAARCVFADGGDCAVRFREAVGGTLEHCVILGRFEHSGVDVGCGCTPRLVRCLFAGLKTAAVESSSATYAQCVFMDCQTGVHLQGSAVMEECEFRSCATAVLAPSRAATLLRSTVSGSTKVGIHLTARSSLTVSECRILHCACGILADTAAGGCVSDSHLAHNTDGLVVDGPEVSLDVNNCYIYDALHVGVALRNGAPRLSSNIIFDNFFASVMVQPTASGCLDDNRIFFARDDGAFVLSDPHGASPAITQSRNVIRNAASPQVNAAIKLTAAERQALYSKHGRDEKNDSPLYRELVGVAESVVALALYHVSIGALCGHAAVTNPNWLDDDSTDSSFGPSQLEHVRAFVAKMQAATPPSPPTPLPSAGDASWKPRPSCGRAMVLATNLKSGPLPPRTDTVVERELLQGDPCGALWTDHVRSLAPIPELRLNTANCRQSRKSVASAVGKAKRKPTVVELAGSSGEWPTAAVSSTARSGASLDAARRFAATAVDGLRDNVVPFATTKAAVLLLLNRLRPLQGFTAAVPGCGGDGGGGGRRGTVPRHSTVTVVAGSTTEAAATSGRKRSATAAGALLHVTPATASTNGPGRPRSSKASKVKQ